MADFELITLAQAEGMSEEKLQVEIGKRNKYLKEQLGMDAVEAANFTSSLLNLGAVLNEKFKAKKNKNN
jgi:hypothetical protein